MNGPTGHGQQCYAGALCLHSWVGDVPPINTLAMDLLEWSGRPEIGFG